MFLLFFPQVLVYLLIGKLQWLLSACEGRLQRLLSACEGRLQRLLSAVEGRRNLQRLLSGTDAEG